MPREPQPGQTHWLHQGAAQIFTPLHRALVSMNTWPNARRRREKLREKASHIDCKWWKKGHCRRGDACYFRHAEELRGVDSGASAAKDEDTQVKGSDDGE